MRTIGFAARSLAIAIVGSLAIAGYAVGRLRASFVRRAHRSTELAKLRGRTLRWGLSRLGAAFIKLGQVMSTRPDLFDPALIGELRMLQDRLPPFPGRRARRLVEGELGGPIGRFFATFDDAPVAAASVAQVHRAELPDGTEVAVKVLRPDVRRKTERDAAILVALARLAMRLSARARDADLAGHVTHFVEGVRAQTDLRIEATHYERFRESFRDFPGVRFPRVHASLCGEKVLTMDFVRGRKVDALPPGAHPQVASVLRNVFLKMLFEDGFLHADMHPGNLLVAEDGTVIVFDVGLCKHLGEELLVQYIDFNRCLVMGTTQDYVHHLRTYHSYVEGSIDWAALERDVDRLRGEFQGKSAGQIEFGALIDRVFAVGRAHGIRPVPDMTLMMVGLVTAEGIGKQLDPGSDSFGEVARYLTPILMRRGMLRSPG